MKSSENLIWIDLEMTGLSPESDLIIEIATIVTDKHLIVLAEGPVFAVHQSEAALAAMDDWNRNQHGRSGLCARVLASDIDAAIAERRTIAFLETWLEAGDSPMCGNSICQDRRFLARHMPALERFFHYRNLDVSTLKELAMSVTVCVKAISAAVLVTVSPAAIDVFALVWLPGVTYLFNAVVVGGLVSGMAYASDA